MHKVKGRAYSAEEKKAIMERLLLAWSKSKYLRLGQLLVCSTSNENLGYTRDIFSVEDEELCKLVENFIEDLNEIDPKE